MIDSGSPPRRLVPEPWRALDTWIESDRAIVVIRVAPRSSGTRAYAYVGDVGVSYQIVRGEALDVERVVRWAVEQVRGTDGSPEEIALALCAPPAPWRLSRAGHRAGT
jgi:hypothetical protein